MAKRNEDLKKKKCQRRKRRGKIQKINRKRGIKLEIQNDQKTSVSNL